MSPRPIRAFRQRSAILVAVALLALGACSRRPVAPAAAVADPLPSWSTGGARDAIVAFVERVTRADGRDFVPAAQRIAVFDNDGTLWAESPLYFPLAFAFDRIRETAPEHPEWLEQEALRAIIDNDTATIARLGLSGLGPAVSTVQSGMTNREFHQQVRDWIATARHPLTGRLYADMAYRPMLELLAYLRANGFKTFICSGGGLEFIRGFAEELYGIPPEQVVGSANLTRFEIRDDRGELVRLPQRVEPFNNAEGKPVTLARHIGRVPILTVGNSDGDLEMLRYTDDGDGPALMMVLHHDDGERADASERGAERVLAEAAARGWTVISIHDDFLEVYPDERPR